MAFFLLYVQYKNFLFYVVPVHTRIAGLYHAYAKLR
jgi:hypothetical protein